MPDRGGKKKRVGMRVTEIEDSCSISLRRSRSLLFIYYRSFNAARQAGGSFQQTPK